MIAKIRELVANSDLYKFKRNIFFFQLRYSLECKIRNKIQFIPQIPRLLTCSWNFSLDRSLLLDLYSHLFRMLWFLLFVVIIFKSWNLSFDIIYLWERLVFFILSGLCLRGSCLPPILMSALKFRGGFWFKFEGLDHVILTILFELIIINE
jgi:hypothetical protein